MVLNRVALTGASGMVGGHLMSLLKGKTEVVASSRRPVEESEGVTWFPWNLEEWKSVEELNRAFGPVDAVFHAGAMLPDAEGGSDDWRRAMFDVNVRGSLCVAEWALRSGTPLVFVSSATVYADSYGARITEEAATVSAEDPSFYALTKREAERVLESLVAAGLKVVILRPSAIYGSGLAPAKLIPRFLRLAADDQVIELAPPAGDRVNLIYAADVAAAMVQAVTREAWGVFNIAGAHSSSISEIAETCVRVVGKGQVKEIAAAETAPPRGRFDLCIDAARQAFDFSPRYDLYEGLADTWKALN
jgi:nucleoside-diphosphate-sugar epimerase